MNKYFKSILIAFPLLVTSAPAFGQSNDWQRRVAAIVASKQVYPRLAQMRGQEGTVRVRISVSAAGTIDNVEVLSPSGSAVLNKEAVDLARRAGPYPPPPGGAANVVLPLTWKLL